MLSQDAIDILIKGSEEAGQTLRMANDLLKKGQGLDVNTQAIIALMGESIEALRFAIFTIAMTEPTTE